MIRFDLECSLWLEKGEMTGDKELGTAVVSQRGVTVAWPKE